MSIKTGGFGNLPMRLALTGLAVCASPRHARGLQEAQVDRIVIDKSDHRMDVFAGDRLLETYSVAIGRGGSGPKELEGDGRTPEGKYRVSGRHMSKRFHRFIALSYPNANDQTRHRALKAEGKIPKNARIGGSIGIHGEPDTWSFLPHKLIDWTAGCIAVDDDEIEELYSSVRVGAEVIIQP